MRRSETFHTDNSGFARAMAFVQQFLTDCGLEKKARIKAKLVVEEILGSLMAHRRGDDMRISARALLGTVTIELAVKGEPFSLTENMLSPVKTMYLNALKMVVAPVVFFSIVACIVQFSDLSALGRIGGKTLALYLCTTFIAVGVGIGAFYLFQPGSANMMEMAADASAITSKTVSISIKDTIVGIVPTNFLSPFLESNMLQLIFLAVVCGIAAGLIGKYSAMLTDLFQACNDLFLKITTLFIKVIPVAVFCSITSMILTMGTRVCF